MANKKLLDRRKEEHYHKEKRESLLLKQASTGNQRKNLEISILHSQLKKKQENPASNTRDTPQIVR